MFPNDDDEEEFGGYAELSPRKWRWNLLVVSALELASAVCSAGEDFFNSLCIGVAAHEIHHNRREQFHREATLEIESLTGEQ